MKNKLIYLLSLLIVLALYSCNQNEKSDSVVNQVEITKIEISEQEYLSDIIGMESIDTTKELSIYGEVIDGNFNITITRTSENDKSVTGEVFVNGIFACHSLELPWKNNASYISSIPSGTYDAILRYDKADKWRLQLLNVPGRSGIQLHVGNWPTQIEGCVLVGDQVYNYKNELRNSVQAYNRIKEQFYGTRNPTSTPDVDITVTIKYNAGRTVFDNGRTDHNRNKYTYIKQAIWQDGHPANPTPTNWKEYKRDLKHVYMKDPDGSMHLRISLFGGNSEYAFNINGPWRRSSSSYSRTN